MTYPRRTFLRLALAGSGALLVSACRKETASAPPPGVDYYTCAMHTFVRAKAPGKCPVCGMELIPVMHGGMETAAAAGPAEFTVPSDRQQQIGVTYTNVERRALRRSMSAVGTVSEDRAKSWAIIAGADGTVAKLLVTSPGEEVAAGQPLLSLYSPDLSAAELDYAKLLATRGGASRSLLDAARDRLREWNVAAGEISALERGRKPGREVTLGSPSRGIVREVAAEQGGSVKAGDRLIELADLSRIWVWADFYEAELGALRQGQKAVVTVSAWPGEKFEGEVSLIDPFLDAQARTIKVRIDLANPALKLRPGMYADVTVDAGIGEGLVIPLNAVMPTGTRNLVFVDRGEGRLEPRDVTLGAEMDDGYEVTAGLREGERIVSSAVFLIDAEAQLQGALKSLDSGLNSGEARQ